MRRSLVALLLALAVLLVSCPADPAPPPNNDGVWDSSNWDSTAVWK